MQLIDVNWNPTDRQLRQFGVACLILMPLIGWLATGKPRTLEAANLPVLGGLAGFGLLLAVIAMNKPCVLKPLFLGASLAAMPIGLVVGEVVLVLVFFGVFLPMALVFRLIGRDALQRGLDRNAKSYWQPKAQPRDAGSYYRQF
jgi:hypothetical protein